MGLLSTLQISWGPSGHDSCLPAGVAGQLVVSWRVAYTATGHQQLDLADSQRSVTIERAGDGEGKEREKVEVEASGGKIWWIAGVDKICSAYTRPYANTHIYAPV